MIATQRILLLCSCLYFFWACNQPKNYKHLDGNWHRIANKYSPNDTVRLPNYSDSKVGIFTIKSDSGFSDHFYSNDSLILIDNSEKVDLLRISLSRGLITFQRKSLTQDSTKSIEFFANYEIDELHDSVIMTLDGTFKYEMLNDNEIMLNGNTYKRIK